TLQDQRPPLAPVPLQLKRLPTRLIADERRVITRAFFPGGEARVRSVIGRVDDLSDRQVQRTLRRVLEAFKQRHFDIERVFEQHYRRGVAMADPPARLTYARQLLIGSYFTMEYSVASAALFNPSIVPHPDQHGVPQGARRFI